MQFLIRVLLLSTSFILLFRNVHALLSQDTLYDYNNRTLYIHLHNHDQDDLLSYGTSPNKLFKIPFDDKYLSGNQINTTIASPPNDLCHLVLTTSDLYSLCPSTDGLLNVNKYNSELDDWNNVTLASKIQYYNDSTYLFTNSDKTGIYIFSGISTDSSNGSLTKRMLRLDTLTWKTTNATSQVQPRPFYKSTPIQINPNTQALFGGITSDEEMISMMEVPVWQYNSWAERPCNISDDKSIEGRTTALVLPVFSKSNSYTTNENSTDWEVSSVFMMGGLNSDGEDADPTFASLNVSTNVWQWDYLENSFATDSIVAAGMIYDTLFTIRNSSTLTKRSIDSENLIIQLYNSTDLSSLEAVDYTDISTSSSTKTIIHVSKNLIIALSVIIPILVIIILGCLVAWLYKRYKQKKEEELNEKEIKEIVDFYEHQHKQLSELTFSSMDSDYKSNEESNYMFEQPTTSDTDNSSINSWKKKREEYAQQKYVFDTMKPTIENIPLTGTGSLKRSLSVASNFLSHSLKRNGSTHSSIATFFTAKSNITSDPEQQLDMKTFSRETKPSFDDDIFSYDNFTDENPFRNSLYTNKSNSMVNPKNRPEKPAPAVPRHSTLVTFPNRTNSTLNHIPEESSIKTFHSQSLGFVSMRKAYTPQQEYMRQMACKSIDSSLTNTSSMHSQSSRSSRRPLSVTSTSTSSSSHRTFAQGVYRSDSIQPSENKNYYYQTQHEGERDQYIDETDDTGSVIDDGMDNMEVQVLVGSKRRSKLRVVNPDTVVEQDEENPDPDNPFDNIHQIEEKPRCTSSSSENSIESGNVRKRVMSDEHHDESYMELNVQN